MKKDRKRGEEFLRTKENKQFSRYPSKGYATVISNNSFSYYARKSNFKTSKRLRRQQFKKVMGRFFEITREHLLENTSGVYLDNFGYLAIVICPETRLPFSSNPEEKKFLNINNENKFYSPMLFPSINNHTIFSGWSMDRAFTDKVKQGLFNKINDGYKYKLAYTLIKSYKKSTSR